MKNTPLPHAVALARKLYEGETVPHHSCGIAIAKAFGLPAKMFHGLRKGGITGFGECGAIVAGRLVLGELLGDDNLAGPASDTLTKALEQYHQHLKQMIDKTGNTPFICHVLTKQFAAFHSKKRSLFCLNIVTAVAQFVDETVHAHSQQTKTKGQKRLHLVISGRVQGVWYRASASETANRLLLKGWVCNCSNGNVELVAEGPQAALDELLRWCWEGPPLAHVTQIETEWLAATGEFDDFSTR